MSKVKKAQKDDGDLPPDARDQSDKRQANMEAVGEPNMPEGDEPEPAPWPVPTLVGGDGVTMTDGPTMRTTMDVVYLPLDLLEPHPLNPNVETPDTFNALVTTLQEDGPDQPIVVVPQPGTTYELARNAEGTYVLGEVSGKFTIIKGEHRWRAARVIGWDQFPCVVRSEWSDGLTQITKLVRDNVVRGDLDKTRFTALVAQLRRDHQIDQDLLAAMTGFESTKEMAKYLARDKRAQSELDEAAAVDKAKADLQIIDDLSLVLNTLFTKHGHTLPYGYLAFFWAGQMSYLVEMTPELRDAMAELARVSEARKVDINLLLGAVLKDGVPALAPSWMAQPVMPATNGTDAAAPADDAPRWPSAVPTPADREPGDEDHPID